MTAMSFIAEQIGEQAHCSHPQSLKEPVVYRSRLCFAWMDATMYFLCASLCLNNIKCLQKRWSHRVQMTRCAHHAWKYIWFKWAIVGLLLDVYGHYDVTYLRTTLYNAELVQVVCARTNTYLYSSRMIVALRKLIHKCTQQQLNITLEIIYLHIPCGSACSVLFIIYIKLNSCLCLAVSWNGCSSRGGSVNMNLNIILFLLHITSFNRLLWPWKVKFVSNIYIAKFEYVTREIGKFINWNFWNIPWANLCDAMYIVYHYKLTEYILAYYSTGNYSCSSDQICWLTWKRNKFIINKLC